MTENSAVMVLVVLLVLIVAIWLPRLRAKKSMGASPLLGASPDRVREEMERLSTDLHDLSREQIAVLDTKIRVAQQLARELDEKRAVLERLLTQIQQAGGVAPPPSVARPADPAPVPLPPANPLHGRVHGLADQGRTREQIASELGLDKGEVDLILGLRS